MSERAPGRTVRILITGGGTGGHVSPAVAVVEEIRRQAEGADWVPEFLYVGTAKGLEARIAPERGIPFASVATGKLRRAASLRGMLTLDNMLDLLRVPVGIVQAGALIRRFRPDVVFSTGGYVAVPAVTAAGLRGIPVLAHEQTVQVGLGNRITARFATRIALSFDGADSCLPVSARKKAFVAGNPVRTEVLSGDPVRAAAWAGFSPDDIALPTVYVTGGAQGSHLLNIALQNCMPRLCTMARVILQCGRQPGVDQDLTGLLRMRDALPESVRCRCHVTPFVQDELGDVFALADVVVGRSGAGTVSEIAALGKPALYVPLVPTGGDEQTKNAQRFVDLQAAVVVPQSQLSGDTVLQALEPLLLDAGLRKRMGARALRLARPHAAVDLAHAVLELAGVRSGDGTR